MVDPKGVNYRGIVGASADPDRAGADHKSVLGGVDWRRDTVTGPAEGVDWRAQFGGVDWRQGMANQFANKLPTDIAWAGTHTVAEDAVLGTVVGGTLTFVDPDPGETGTFSVTDSRYFDALGTDIIVTGVLDFDEDASHDITIRFTDSRGGIYDEIFTVTVTDVAEDPPEDPLPSGAVVEDDGTFQDIPIITQVNDAIKIHGKKTAGSLGKFIVDLGPAEAGVTYTIDYEFDGSLMTNLGRNAMIMFVFKQGNDFHAVGPMGDGTANGVNFKQVYGDNKWTSGTGLTEVDTGTPQNGDQYEGWLQVEVSEDGETYTPRTATGGSGFVDEFSPVNPEPHTDVVGPDQFGIGMIFQANDTGPFALTIRRWIAEEAGDPFIANVVFLADFEGTDGATTYTEQAKRRPLTSFNTGAIISDDQAEYGTTSLQNFNVSSWTVPDSDDFDLSNANSDQFTIEWSAYNPDRANTYSYFNTLFGGGNFGWLPRLNITNIEFFWSSDGTNLQSLTAPGEVGTANAWHKYCVEKDGTGKIRIYRDGAMVASATPADSSFFNANGDMVVASAVPAASSWTDNMRITKGVARYASDAGYTPATGPFPTPSGVLDGINSLTAAWSVDRELFDRFAGGAKYTDDGGGSISSLKDQSGFARHFNAGNNPTLTTAGPQSRACLNFNGTDDVLSTGGPDPLSDFITASTGYLYAVVIVDATTTNDSQFYPNDAVFADNSGFMSMGFKNGAAIAGNWDGSSDMAVHATSLDLGGSTVYVIEWRHEGGNLYVRVNGAGEVSVASGNTTTLSAILLLGRNYDGSAQFCDFKFFEGAAFSVPPTLAQRDAIVASALAHYA